MFDESVKFFFKFLHLSASLLNITDSRYSQYDFLISFSMVDLNLDSLHFIFS